MIILLLIGLTMTAVGVFAIYAGYIMIIDTIETFNTN